MQQKRKRESDDHISDKQYQYCCANCEDTNVDNVTSHYTRDSDSSLFHCRVCGLESSINPIPLSQYNDRFSTTVVRGKQGTYRRKSHITERFRCHICKEPAIPENAKARIRSMYEQFISNGQLTASQNLAKPDIQKILRQIDAEDRQQLQSTNNTQGTVTTDNHPEEGEQPPTKKVKHQRGYSIKYLEKFKTIICMLAGEWQDMKYLNDSQIGETATVFCFFSHTWDQWKREGRYPERKHFPNFNLTILRIFAEIDLLDYVDLDEFPVPDKDSSKVNLDIYINALVEEAYKKKVLLR